MLVLSRKINDQIHIGSNITITILKRKGKSILLGIDAPREMHVIRAELQEQPKNEIELPATPISNRSTPSSSAPKPLTENRSSCRQSNAGTLPLLQRLPSRCRAQEQTAKVNCAAPTEATMNRRPPHPDRWTVGRMQERTRASNGAPVEATT